MRVFAFHPVRSEDTGFRERVVNKPGKPHQRQQGSTFSPIFFSLMFLADTFWSAGIKKKALIVPMEMFGDVLEFTGDFTTPQFS